MLQVFYVAFPEICDLTETREKLDYEDSSSYVVNLSPNRGGNNPLQALEGSMDVIGLRPGDRFIIRPSGLYPPEVTVVRVRLRVQFVRKVVVILKRTGGLEDVRIKVRH